MELTFDEINDANLFEDLVEKYFKKIASEGKNIANVDVISTGEGGDGGTDLLLDIKLDDSLDIFSRKWVVQCKFYESSVGKSALSDHNIPTLIHEYEAVGYLLVCKSRPTATLVKSFENLNANCKFGYCYKIWRGVDLLEKIRLHRDIIEIFFPKHGRFLKQMESKGGI